MASAEVAHFAHLGERRTAQISMYQAGREGIACANSIRNLDDKAAMPVAACAICEQAAARAECD